MIFQIKHITISQMEEAEKGFKKGLNIELKPLELTEAQFGRSGRIN